ncbi:MAG: ABC transporter substrate-binding protein [Lysobacteraceae bacterium]|nr:MAG: ABC transporter substrate-binding protein [Xanthomonadaceae bacterium]
MTIKTTAHALAIASVLLSAHAALAQQPAAARTAPASAMMQGSPSQLVLNNSQRVLSTLEKRRAEFSKNRAVLREYISTEFNAMFDRDYAARLVLGRHSRGASDADVKLFADALADNLMQRYGSSLLDFNTQLRVRVKSETVLSQGRGVKVSSEFLRQGGEPIPVDYFMRKTGTQWKVFDVMVEGVSYVQTFRNQFDAELQRKTIKQVATELRNGQLRPSARQ